MFWFSDVNHFRGSNHVRRTQSAGADDFIRNSFVRRSVRGYSTLDRRSNAYVREMSVSPGPSASVAMPTVAITDRLQAAAAQGQLDVVKDLVKSGIPTHPDREGRSALHFAALNGHVNVCEYLLDQGCNLDAQDSVGYSPLHRAASQGHVQALELFLKKGCAVDTQDENGNAAVHEAAWNGYSQTLDLLIKFNCNIQLTNKAGFTALHLSAQNGHNQSTRVLLLAGCNADVKNNYGDTALHTAARYGHAGVTRILISARCCLNEQNKNGDTALHIAAALKRRKIAKLLVDASIDVYVRNKQNETAMEVARRKEHQEIIVIISSFARPKTPKSSNPKVVNFKDVPVDIIEGPVVVPDNETPAKPEKQEKKFFDFFRKKKKDKDKDQGGNTPSGGALINKDPAVQGFFSQYIPRPGVQYYRDLAGNIKQGPIGYTPVCQCMPSLKKLEHQVHTNKEAVHDHIEASNRVLTQRMDQIDRRTLEQVQNLDRFTKNRFDEEEHNCRNRIQQRIEEEREYMKSHYQENIKLDVQDWLEAKLGTYGHCLDHHHDDNALPSNNIFSEIHHTENGRLFKSRSDETLSQSDNHSGKFRKKDFYESRTAAMQQIRAWQVPVYGQGKGRTRDINDNVRSANYRTQNGSHALNQGQPHRGQGHYAQGHYMGHPGPNDRNISASQGHMVNRNEPVRRSNVNFASKQDILSPSTESTSRSPYSQSPNDPVYGHYAHHGAIPKRMSHSHTVHNGEHWRQDSSPVTQSTPKLNESSQMYGRGMVRSKTDSEGFLQRPEERDAMYREQFRRNAAQRQSAPNRSYAHTQEMDNSRAGFQKNSDVRQSFQERGSSNTNINTGISPAVVTSSVMPGAGQGPQESNSRPSSGKSDEKSENHYNSKPTFTTFGYEETKTAPQSVSQNVRGDENSSSVQRPASSMRQEYPYSQPLKRSQTPNDELERSTPRRGGSQPVYGYFRPDQSKVHEGSQNTISNSKGPSQTHTDKYPEIAPKPVLRQRTRSSDGLLLEDGITSAHELAQRSKSEERTLDSTPNAPQILRSQTPQTPRSSSEMRPQGQQNYVNSNAGVPYRYPGHPGVQGQPSAQRPQHLPYDTGVQQPYHQHQNSFSHVKSPQANPSRYPPHEQYNRGQDGGQGLRENPYASVRNVSQYKAPGNVQYGVINKQGLPYRSTYNVNYANQGEKTPFRESSPIVKSFSKSESNLDRSLNDSDHDPGYTSPVNPRGDFLTCRTPTGEISANRDNTKSVANYPNAYNKEDSSSNPDSGYSSKIFGSRTNAGNIQSNSGTPSSSFSTDHDHSMSIPSNNNSPHPQVSHSDYDQIQNVHQRQQVQGQHLQNHVQTWYQKKLQEAAQRLREGPYNKDQGDSPPPTVAKHNQYHYGQPTDIYNNQSNYPLSQYHSNKDYVNSNYQRIFIRGSDV